VSFFLEGFLFLFFFLASERSVVDVAVFFFFSFRRGIARLALFFFCWIDESGI
jgi:hypothetical protein